MFTSTLLMLFAACGGEEKEDTAVEVVEDSAVEAEDTAAEEAGGEE